jgi:prophage regulatory protein
MPRSGIDRRGGDPHITDQLISIKKVAQITGLGRTSIYDRIKRRSFPQPVKLSTRWSRWSKLEIDDWVSKLVARTRSLDFFDE